MLPRPLALALALLVAGCAGPGADDDGDEPGDDGGPARAGRFLAPVELARDGGPEPVVVVAPDGAVWIAAQDAGGGAPRVWVSTDGGASFALSRPSRAGGGEVDIAVGSGAAYVTQLGPGGNVVSYSRDRGATWQQSTFAGTNYFERELVAVDARGSVYLASRFGIASLAAAPTGDDATIARSDDGGITFVPAGRVWDAQHEPGTRMGNVLAYAGGLGVAYDCRDGRAVCFARSADRGVTWTQRVVAQRAVDVANVYPVLAADGARLLLVWSDATDGRLAVWGAASRDDGATWSAPARLSEATETATLGWVAAGGGRAWLVYASTDVDGTDAGAAGFATARWHARAARLDADLAVAERAEVLADVVHEGVISKPVGRAGAGGPYDRTFGDFFTVAVDAQGRAFVALPITTGGTTRDVLVAERR